MGQQTLPYNRIALTPIDYIKRFYRMIEGQYFLFFGITMCALLIGSVAPFGVLCLPEFTSASSKRSQQFR